MRWSQARGTFAGKTQVSVERCRAIRISVKFGTRVRKRLLEFMGRRQVNEKGG